MNKTEIIIKLSIPAMIVTGYACYKLGEISGCIKTAKVFLNEKTKDNSED